MPAPRCPGQDMRYWTPDDIFDVSCPYCATEIEFWKDEPVRICRGCGMEVRNPRIDLGCAKWCKYAEQCLGKNIGHLSAAAPIIEHLRADVQRILVDEPARLAFAEEVQSLADTLAAADHEADPRIVKCAALLLGADLAPNDLLEAAGLDQAAAKRVRSALNALRSEGQELGREEQIVHDALRIAEMQRDSPLPDPDSAIGQLLLDHARLLARRRIVSP